MTDQLISFKTAKLAKKKGFNIITRCGHESSLYNKHGSPIYYTNYGLMGSGLFEDYISAPTQSLLQKWSREIHNFEVSVYCNASGWLWDINKAFHIKWLSGGTSISSSQFTGPNNSGEWNTYEEALEQGLFESLKLIKL